MNGKIPSSMVIVPGKVDDNRPDAFSQGAFAQLFKEEFEMEHGPVECKTRLAPTLELWKEINGNPRTTCQPPQGNKLKKCKQDNTTKERAVNEPSKQTKWTVSGGGKVADAARTRIALAVGSK